MAAFEYKVGCLWWHVCEHPYNKLFDTQQLRLPATSFQPHLGLLDCRWRDHWESIELK